LVSEAPPRRFDPADMASRGRIGAFTTHSRHDPHATTERARAAFMERFERQVDPERALSADERARRADYACRAHMARLARLSARARRKGGEAAL
jgi:hypothetical protein